MMDVDGENGYYYTLTKLETPFGLLPKPVQIALKGLPHGGVEQYTTCGWRNHAMHRVSYHPCVVYRAKSAPVEMRVECWRGPDLHWGTCVKGEDGTIDWSTWKDRD